MQKSEVLSETGSHRVKSINVKSFTAKYIYIYIYIYMKMKGIGSGMAVNGVARFSDAEGGQSQWLPLTEITNL